MSESEDLFTREDPIFVQKELLEINHLPDEGRIVGRDDEIKELANAVNPAIFGQSPSNVLLYGKTGTGKSVRGARNVHRGYAQNSHGPVTKSGQTQLGSSDSKAYTLGSSAQSAKGHAGRYNNLRQSKTGRMRDKAKVDASHATQAAKARSKQAFRNTKEKVSRW